MTETRQDEPSAQDHAAGLGRREAPSQSEYVPPYPQTFGAKIGHLLRHIKGQGLLRRLRHAHNDMARAADALGTHLENDVFPILLEEGREWLTLEAREESGQARLIGASGDRPFSFPGTDALARWLASNDIARVRLSAHLEAGQVTETLLMLVHAEGSLRQEASGDSAYAGWDAAPMAGAMLTADGYHKFCAEMRFSLSERCYTVEYSYCDLFMARVVTMLLKRAPRYHDHRTLFSAAPRVGIFTLLLVALPICLIPVSLPWAVISGLFVAIIIGLGVSASIHALASVQYAREHYDLLQKGLLKQVTALARFPETNPNPILKLSAEGKVLYVNPSARRLLEDVGLQEEEAHELLPKDYKEMAAACLSEQNESLEVDHEIRGRTLHFRFSPFRDGRFVIAAGDDITYLKRIESDLRELNEHLEEKVGERTEQLCQTQDVTILCLAGLAETRDPDTGRHLQRTRAYVKVLAEALREHPQFCDVLNDEVIDNLHKSSPLHDIGKVGIADAILFKPGELTDEEFEQMKKHPVYGGDALRWANERLGFDSFLRVGQDIAYNHHEEWDGSGYPKGLKGQEIPWAARLMALADVYDALRSRRVYKEPFTHEKARCFILEGKGLRFDPDVVEAFMQMEDEFVRIAEEFAD